MEIKYIDNELICGWYCVKEGQPYGDGTKEGAVKVMEYLREETGI
jgi:hypothetical protein